VLSDHADLGLVRIGVLETISQPVRHGVTEHKNAALRRTFAFLWRRRF
jgi:hypothetical protein